MELGQLRCFVTVVELGSFCRAAKQLSLADSSVDQQLRALETELCTTLLCRTGKSLIPTDAGMAFFREAQLTLRHAEQAARVPHEARLSGKVSIGLPPTVASVLGLPLMLAMRERYPEVRLHLVESLSGHLANLLNARQLDLAVLYGTHPARRWSVIPLLEERLLYVQSARRPLIAPLPASVALRELASIPLLLPSSSHGLRTILDAGFSRARCQPTLAGEIDSLAMLMDAVDAGLGGTLQPWSATRRVPDAADRFQLADIADAEAHRLSSLCSLSNEELSPAALAARVVLSVCARELARSGGWSGTRLHAHEA